MLRLSSKCVWSVKYTQAGIVNVILIISNQEPSLSKQAEAAYNNGHWLLLVSFSFLYIVLYIANTIKRVFFCQKNISTELWQAGLLRIFVNNENFCAFWA